MTQAMIFDAVRTPRGEGKKDGSLHEVKPWICWQVARQAAEAPRLRSAALDDVVMGVVSPVGEQGSVIAKTAALKAGWDVKVAGVQINRFCASGLEAVNIAAQKVASGWEDMVVAGGVEHVAGADRLRRRRLVAGPATNIAIGFVPQGIGADLIATLAGWGRDDVDRYALTSQQRAAAAQAAGHFDRSVLPSTTRSASPCSSATSSSSRGPRSKAWARSRSPSPSSGRWASTRSRARYPQVERIEHVHTAGNSSGIVDGAAAVLIGSEAKGREPA